MKEENKVVAELEKEMKETVEEEQTTDSDETTKTETNPEQGPEPVQEIEKESEETSDKTNQKQTKLEEKLAQLEEQRVRQLAEFENFRKRSDREKSQMFEFGVKEVIEKILPIIDNFERGFMTVSEEEKSTPFAQGMEMVYKQMMTAFEELGVKPIEAVGQEFDPNLHNAVMMVDDDTKESGTVAEELQKGYMYKETIVRHSMVKVVN